MSLGDGKAVRSWTLHLLCMPVLRSSKIVESNDMSSKKLSPSGSRETERYVVQSRVVSTGHGGSGSVKSVRSIGMMSIESTDSALASRHLRRRARSRSPKHERADKKDITMPQVQEHRQEEHLVHLAAVGTSKTDTTVQDNFGSHHLFPLVLCKTTSISIKTYIGHMDLIRHLKPVEGAG